ncbi:MAG TPA: methyltransferase domain-containing protein [Deltaproteobacteria bacterium]|jgi:ubiquinone/menaquinone biosynthesis C-methylase UbiE|nr:methyltransferase domain-containing protein [Deltaproteobacteria bacterium]HOI06658.1 methyltransferase domain-containing protein [Deltaproteobacteria bacterium]
MDNDKAEAAGTRGFDAEAAAWDDDPGRVKLSEDIARAVRQEITLGNDMDMLDFGCGTGLLTLRLAPLVRSAVCADSSRGMLDVLQGKIEQGGIGNVQTLHLETDGRDELAGGFHLVVSSMTLHHVPDIFRLFEKFARVTLPGGHLCIADLDPDEGKFHSSNEGVFHHGLDRSALAAAMQEAGFEEVRHRTVSGVVKFVVGEGMTVFTVFLMIGRKKPS